MISVPLHCIKHHCIQVLRDLEPCCAKLVAVERIPPIVPWSDVVIGDVFSIDLALPQALREAGAAGLHGLCVLLRRNHYTPAWSLAAIAGHPADGVVESLEGLAEWVECRLH